MDYEFEQIINSALSPYNNLYTDEDTVDDKKERSYKCQIQKGNLTEKEVEFKKIAARYRLKLSKKINSNLFILKINRPYSDTIVSFKKEKLDKLTTEKFILIVKKHMRSSIMDGSNYFTGN